MEYAARITKEGKYTLAEFPDCPGCQTFSDSPATVEEVAQDALVGWLESNLGRGLVPPTPSTRVAPGFRGIPVPASLAVRLELRWARESAGLTQSQLAERAGMSQQAIQKLESRSANPTIETLDKVARGLGGTVYVRFSKFAQPRVVRETRQSYGGDAHRVARKSSNNATSAKVASKAPKLLRNGRSSAESKSVAASDLTQARSKSKSHGKRGY